MDRLWRRQHVTNSTGLKRKDRNRNGERRQNELSILCPKFLDTTWKGDRTMYAVLAAEACVHCEGRYSDRVGTVAR